MKKITTTALLMTLFALTTAVVDAHGLYQAEDYDYFTYSGSGWVQVVDGGYVVMESTQAGDSVSFPFVGSDVIIYREMVTTGSSITNALVGGTASAESQSGSYVDDNAFDNDVNTFWSATKVVTWIKYDLGEGNSLSPSIASITSRPLYPNQTPRDFSIEGSNDDTNWTSLASFTNQIDWIAGETRTYPLTSTGYRYFRLSITANNGGGSSSVAEFALSAGINDVSICVDALCTSVLNQSFVNRIDQPIAFDVEQGSHTLTMTNVSGNTFRFNYVIVLAAVVSEGGGSDPILPETIAPDPSRHYFTLDSGRVVAIDFVLSGGDITTIILLAFLSSVTVYRFVAARWSDA